MAGRGGQGLGVSLTYIRHPRVKKTLDESNNTRSQKKGTATRSRQVDPQQCHMQSSCIPITIWVSVKCSAAPAHVYKCSDSPRGRLPAALQWQAGMEVHALLLRRKVIGGRPMLRPRPGSTT